MISGIDSAAAKITRAAAHLNSINHAMGRLTFGTGTYEIVKDAKGNEEVRFLIDPPPEIGILAGEIVYQLRSALDHLAFDLVQLNPSGIALPANWHKKCDFPMESCLEKVKGVILPAFIHLLQNPRNLIEL